LNKPGRTEGVRKIAARFGVDPGTVQPTLAKQGIDKNLAALRAEERSRAEVVGKSDADTANRHRGERVELTAGEALP
jgi:hypothetical protein